MSALNFIKLGWLLVIAILSPLVALPISELARPVLELFFGAKSGHLPGFLERSALTACLLATTFVRPGFIDSYVGVSPRVSLIISGFWAVGGTVLWLGLLFFTGTLPSLDRGYSLTHVATHGLLSLSAVVLFQASKVILGALAALTVLWIWLDTPGLPNISTGRGNASTTLRELWSAISNPPYVTLLAFIASALIGHVFARLVLRRYISGNGGLVGDLAGVAVWIVGTLATWILFLYFLGALDVPRWLPFALGIVMGLAGAIQALGLVSQREGGIKAALYDPSLAASADAQAELIAGQGTAGSRSNRRAWIISYTGVSNEPRVLRQCEALIGAGWDVVVCGYDGHSARPEAWTFIRLPKSAPFSNSGVLLSSIVQRFGSFVLVQLYRSNGKPAWAARLVHETTPLWWHTREQLLHVAKAHPELKADLVVGHDYHTCDAAYAVAKFYGAKFSADIHEYAPGQYFNDPEWVIKQRPVAIGVQRYYLERADLVTVVCQGIADLLAQENKLKVPPVTIRSVPFKSVQPFRPVGAQLQVLYHGDLSTRREIYTLIESMKLWRKDIDLLLRGAGDPAYIAELKRQIQRHNLVDRVRFEPPVPFSEIISAANMSDIGFFSFKGDSPRFASRCRTSSSNISWPVSACVLAIRLRFPMLCGSTSAAS